MEVINTDMSLITLQAIIKYQHKKTFQFKTWCISDKSHIQITKQHRSFLCTVDTW